MKMNIFFPISNFQSNSEVLKPLHLLDTSSQHCVLTLGDILASINSQLDCSGFARKLVLPWIGTLGCLLLETRENLKD